jgi:transposase
MPQPTVLPPLSTEAHAGLLAHYNAAADPETRTRYQMVLLAVERDLNPRQIAPLVQRSHDVVLKVLQRFRDDGLAAVPHQKGPGPAPKVTEVWRHELLRVVEDDPHRHGVHSANWTTQLLADHRAATTGIATNQETVCRYLHRADYVCKRPPCTRAAKAAEREGPRGLPVGEGCEGRSS